MFAPAKALDACRAFFIQQGVNIDVLRFDSTIAAFFDFYRDERAEGCAVDEDGDMLLFEWGAVDWGEGDHFELSLARQLIFGPGDGKIWQLKLTYAYEPTAAFRALGAGNRWCDTLDALAAFREWVDAADAYRTAAEHAEIGIVSIGFYITG